MIGTSARLVEGEKVYLNDLLYGMMLPSGNDAAWALAEFFGYLVREEESKGPPVKTFVAYMNTTAINMGLSDTTFANPHGLSNINSRSTA